MIEWIQNKLGRFLFHKPNYRCKVRHDTKIVIVYGYHEACGACFCRHENQELDYYSDMYSTVVRGSWFGQGDKQYAIFCRECKDLIRSVSHHEAMKMFDALDPLTVPLVTGTIKR